MKIGICAGLEKLEKFEKMGFDYIEVTVTSLMAMGKEEFSQALDKVQHSAIGVEACNIFFPKSMVFVGPGTDMAALEEYLHEAIGRVAATGAKCIVFGSGASRTVPAGFDASTAREQLRDTIALAGKIAAPLGVTIVIEPLNKGETNMINTVEEGRVMAEEIGHEGVKLLADFYHMRVENEPMENVRRAGALLRHTHIARGQGRTYPLRADEDCYGEFFAALKAAGYTGRLSIEGRTGDGDTDAPASLAFLRGMAEKAGL